MIDYFLEAAGSGVDWPHCQIANASVTIKTELLAVNVTANGK